jgi:alpha-galactosidase
MKRWNTFVGRSIVAVAGILGMLAALPTYSLPGQDQDTAAMLRAQEAPTGALWVETLDLSNLTQDYGEPHAGRSVDDAPLTLGGVVFPHGIGTHAGSELRIALKGVATRFVSMVGVDDERKNGGSVAFEVWVDGKKAAQTDVLHGGDAPKLISVPLTGAKILTLRVTDGGDGIANDHADWAGAMLLLTASATDKPISVGVPNDPPRMVIPPPDPKPALHGASITGATPGHPFLFHIAATGDGPLSYAATGLPKGLMLDTKTGILSGALVAAGTAKVRLTVRGPQGTTSGTLTIVGGDHKLALTPPMGWNSWNCWAGAVDADKVKAAADWMLKSGLAAHGFQYVNIDDTWEAGRDANGEIQTNEKFPDMKALADYVHAQGLKLGIYSSPGPKTCAGYTASYQHEVQDAKTYAKWGIDYLKHDWCSYGDVATGEGLDRVKKPYITMRQALDQANRDIIYSLCQYGMGDVWQWGGLPDVGGNCWRTTGDINDSWSSLHGIYTSQNGHEKYVGPGHWNDPDMLVVGKVGWGPSLHPSHLKPNEQILHITMWCLLSSPLLIGCDMSQMDPFTIALLSNDEALAINQDSLGKPAGRVALDDTKEVWARKLADGTLAVGLINAGTETTKVTASWKDLGLKGEQPVRDLWLHKDQGVATDAVTVEVPAHGAVLLKIGHPKHAS